MAVAERSAIMLRLADARAAIAEVETVEEAIRLAGFAESVRYAARQARAGVELENAATEVRLRAERRAGELLAVMEKASGTRGLGRPPLGGTRTVPPNDAPPTIAGLGVSKGQSSVFQQVAAVPEERFEAYVRSPTDRLSRSALLKAARRDELAGERARVAASAAPLAGESYTLLLGAVDAVEPGEVDVIVTDPPYGRDFLPAYGLLSAAAARHLRPGGSLFAMIGQSYLPEALALLGSQLTYRWTLAYLTPGGQSPAAPLATAGVNSFWKPVVWFTCGEPDLPALGDVIRTEPNGSEKDAHDWQQSVGGMAALLRRCSRPGDLVWDPFCGSGTTGVAAVGLGRRFVGSDLDAAALVTAAARVAEA